MLHDQPPNLPTQQVAGRSTSKVLLPFLCLWTGLLGYSFCHAPIPGVNEPHYLTKSLQLDKPKGSNVLLVTPDRKSTNCALFKQLYSTSEEHSNEIAENSLNALGSTNWISGTLYDEISAWRYKPFEGQIGEKAFVQGLVEMYQTK